MSVLEDIVAAKSEFAAHKGRISILSAHTIRCGKSPTGLGSLAALREALPKPFKDFSSFEMSDLWRKKDAYAVFDRAIAASTPPSNANAQTGDPK